MEETTNPEVEVEETATQETAEEVTDVQTEELTEDQTESDDVDVIEDSEEVEYEGETYKVPKALKDALMRQSDYTRKTQEVADQRKALETDVEQFKQNIAQQQQNIQDYAQLQALDMQLQQFDQIDWNELVDQDPTQAMKLDHQRRQLAEMRGGIAQRIQHTEAQQAFQQQQEIAKQFEISRETLEREIPNWSPGNELDKTLESYAKSYGIENTGQIMLNMPRAGVVLHKAYLYDQMMEKATSQKPPKPQAKPVTKVSTKRATAASRDPDKMTPDEWREWREKQISNKRPR